MNDSTFQYQLPCYLLNPIVNDTIKVLTASPSKGVVADTACHFRLGLHEGYLGFFEETSTRPFGVLMSNPTNARGHEFRSVMPITRELREQLEDAIVSVAFGHRAAIRMSGSTAVDHFNRLHAKAIPTDYQTRWANGTGYLDGALTERPEELIGFTDPDGRRGIIFTEGEHTAVIFERYAKPAAAELVFNASSGYVGPSAGHLTVAPHLTAHMAQLDRVAA